MSRLKIAIFGRPNVGKSTLFNQITGTRGAIVKDEPGVTRDIHYGHSDWSGVSFDIFDTAGVSEGGDKAWSASIREKALEAVATADKVLFVLDGKYGLNPEDKDLTRYVLRLKKPVLAIVNKIDDPENNELGLSEFYGLGFDNLMGASFEHRHGLTEIVNWIVEGREHDKVVLREESEVVRIAVVGKPNAGKSTLVNQILGEDRVVVSPVAGTTVDSVEIPFNRGGKDYILVDTAGLRRHAKRSEAVEKLSAYKSRDAVEQADLLLIVIDALEGPSQQDARIVEMALEFHRGVILVLNKSDLAQKQIPKFREVLKAKIDKEFHFYTDIPVVFASAKTGKGVEDLFARVEKVWQQLNKKITTPEINDFFFKVIRQAPSPSFRGNDIKFFYITQTRQRPPSFMTFVNEPRGVTNSYKRFVINKIKEHYDLHGIPIRVYVKKRGRDSSYADKSAGQK